jgi:hypothetical protein
MEGLVSSPFRFTSPKRKHTIPNEEEDELYEQEKNL